MADAQRHEELVLAVRPAPADHQRAHQAGLRHAPGRRPRLVPLTGLLAGGLVFVTSAAILVLEILAARLLAPYVGLTLETYTGVIGVVLAGIAAGTWCGGFMADRTDPRRMLGPLLLIGGLLALATVPIVRALAGAGLGGGSGGVLALTIGGFFGPAAVLSAVSPTVVKLQLRTLDETGHVVGRLSAVGTAGALVGTFLTGFVLVSAVPTTVTIVVVGLALVTLGVVLTWWAASTSAAMLLVVVAAAVVGSGLSWALGDVCDEETTYHCARIRTDDERPGGRLLMLDTLRHSYVDLDDPTHLEFSYARRFRAVIDRVWGDGEALDALHVGGGGFTMPRWMAATRPGSTGVVLEIDDGLVDLARRRLGLVEGPDLEVRVGDARTLIVDVGDRSADVVLGDAFGGLAVPWHLTTTEFVEEVARVLRPGGLYLVNLIDHPPLRFARAKVATLREVFEHVVVFPPPDGGGNVVVVASQQPLPPSLGGVDGVAFAGGAPVLRDDHAPVDQWLTP